MVRAHDRAIGRRAKHLALRARAAIFSYSYYACEALRTEDGLPQYRFFFQLQAHPRALRDIYQAELAREPQISAPLTNEYELALSEDDFNALSSEPHLANGWVTTSSFAARTLEADGIPIEQIHIVPYGVDGSLFIKREYPCFTEKRIKIVYVGSPSPRKGLHYLLEAIHMVSSQKASLTICTKGEIESSLLNKFKDVQVDIKRGLSGRSLCEELHRNQLFVLPSLAESFGHVILEAMSAGLPVIATNHTCAPDVIRDGIDGFVVPACSSEAIAEKLAWCLDNPTELAQMGEAAAEQARRFTWDRFRVGVARAYIDMVDSVRAMA